MTKRPRVDPAASEKEEEATKREGRTQDNNRFSTRSLFSAEITGGVLLFLLIVTILFGLPLAAAPLGLTIPLGSVVMLWIAGVHAWSAIAVILLLIVHLVASVRQREESDAPRRIWVSGFLLLAVLIGVYLSGYGMRYAAPLGLTPQLGLLFALHALVFPVLLIALVAVHMSRTTQTKLLVVRTGRFMKEATQPALLLIALVVLLALFGPPTLA